jgi:hypothetical protein
MILLKNPIGAHLIPAGAAKTLVRRRDLGVFQQNLLMTSPPGGGLIVGGLCFRAAIGYNILPMGRGISWLNLRGRESDSVPIWRRRAAP